MERLLLSIPQWDVAACYEDAPILVSPVASKESSMTRFTVIVHAEPGMQTERHIPTLDEAE